MQETGQEIVRIPFDKDELVGSGVNSALLGLRVLIADDDVFGRELIGKILSNHMGMSVGITGDGSKAIAEVLSGNYDAAIIGLALPGTSGIEAIRVIKEMRPEFPILAVSSELTVGRKDDDRTYGADMLCRRPVSMSSIIGSLKVIVEGQGLARHQ